MLIETEEMTLKEIENKLWNIYFELSKKHDFEFKSLIIKISNRLRCIAGKCYTNRILDHHIITMSKPLMDEFGWKRFETTFKHELAHAYCEKYYGRCNHNDTFKRTCVLFGGSMNEIMAGNIYRDAGTIEYTKTIKKYRYTCPCGKTIERAKRMSYKIRNNPRRLCVKCGTTIVDWKEERI